MYEIQVLSSSLKKRLSGKRRFTFVKGINFVVGDSGAGKSTVLEIFREHAKFKYGREVTTNFSLSTDDVLYVDFEFCTATDSGIDDVFKALRGQSSGGSARLKFLENLVHRMSNSNKYKVLLIDNLFCFFQADFIPDIMECLYGLDRNIVVVVSSAKNYLRKSENTILLNGKE